jgi:hypothetical protein
MITFPKELFIETMREYFSQDSYYHYVRDPWGYPLTPDHTDLDPQAGLHDDITTRLYIGEMNRFDPIFYPALIVRSAGSRYVPISMNREKGSVQWKAVKYVDGYGNEKIFSTPSHFIQAGAWEGQITIEAISRALRSRDELVQIVSLAFVDEVFDDMKNSGVLIKGVSVGGPTDGEDRNDKLFRQTISFDIRGEWRRHIPVENLVDAINICVDFGNVATNPPQIATNLNISTSVQLIQALQDL